jgi:hypothetical protein
MTHLNEGEGSIKMTRTQPWSATQGGLREGSMRPSLWDSLGRFCYLGDGKAIDLSHNFILTSALSFSHLIICPLVVLILATLDAV